MAEYGLTPQPPESLLRMRAVAGRLAIAGLVLLVAVLVFVLHWRRAKPSRDAAL